MSKIFASGSIGHLLENAWNQTDQKWEWIDHGVPPGTTVVGTPGALLDSADARLKFFLRTANGHIFERYWTQATASWGWTDHGTPPGTTGATDPGAALDSAATGIKFFMGGQDGHLWETYWNQTDEKWEWTDHGVPN